MLAGRGSDRTRDQSAAWPGQVIANNKKVTHTKDFLIKISKTHKQGQKIYVWTFKKPWQAES